MTRQAPAGTSEEPLVTAIRDSANRIFLAGLGAFAKAQEEGSKVFDSLVDEGTTTFDRLVKEAGAVQTRAVGAADDTMAKMKTAAAETWNRLEGIFEDRVADVLRGLNVATKSDIDNLERRLKVLVAARKKPSGSSKKVPSRPAARGGVRRPKAKKSR